MKGKIEGSWEFLWFVEWKFGKIVDFGFFFFTRSTKIYPLNWYEKKGKHVILLYQTTTNLIFILLPLFFLFFVPNSLEEKLKIF